MNTSQNIKVYDAMGRPRQITIQEYIAIEAAEIARLMAQSSKDAAQ